MNPPKDDNEQSIDSESSDQSGLFPLRPQWLEIGFILFLIVWVLYMLYEATGYQNTEDYLLPYMMFTVLIVLLPLKLGVIAFPNIAERFKPGSANTDGEYVENTNTNLETTKREKEIKEILMIFWIFVFPFMIYYVGMGWSLILYVFGFTYFFNRNLKQSIVVTLIVTIFVAILFLYILNLIIWTGELGIPDPLVQIEHLMP